MKDLGFILNNFIFNNFMGHVENWVSYRLGHHSGTLLGIISGMVPFVTLMSPTGVTSVAFAFSCNDIMNRLKRAMSLPPVTYNYWKMWELYCYSLSSIATFFFHSSRA